MGTRCDIGTHMMVTFPIHGGMQLLILIDGFVVICIHGDDASSLRSELCLRVYEIDSLVGEGACSRAYRLLRRFS